MSHIFISYSHKDTVYVEKLEAKLISEGFDVWVDHRIDYGSRWTKEIEKAIDTCDAYVVVMSKNSAESQWVERERIHAEKRRKPFFPLLLDGEGWFSLGNIQFVDVRGGKLPSKDYYDDIARFVSRKENAAAVGAGLEETAPTRKSLLFWVGAVLVLSLLVLIGIALKDIFSGSDTGIGGTPMYATPIDQDSLTITVEPTTEPEEPALVPPADVQLGDTWTRPTDEMVMSYIPAGEFQMGSEDGEEDEKPVHTVYLDAFWMDQTEVTNAMYAECVVSGRCDEPSNREYLDNPAYVQYPVVYVSWEDASNYCEKVGGRLPTESEWEKSARGGLESRKYPWGDDRPVCKLGTVNGAKFDDSQNCNDSGAEPVASFSANGFGLYDMAGNVWEWVADWYGEYPSMLSPLENPLGPASGEYRVKRGGSSVNYINFLRTAYRYRSDPAYPSDSSGFRCARSISE